MPVQGYTPNRNLTKISQGSTDNWDVWYNDVVDRLDEPSILYQISADENLSAGEIAVVQDDGAGAKKAYLADSGTYIFGDPVGFVTETVTAGSPTRLVMQGKCSHTGWSFGSGDKLAYLSVPGTVTTTEPASGAVTLGFVLSSTSLYLNPMSSAGGGGQTNTVTGSNGVINSGGNVDAVMEPVYGAGANTVCEGNDSRLHNQNSDSGTSVSFFDINVNGNSARISTTGLNTDRIFTLPDISTELVGIASDSAITGDHDHSAGVLRLPTNSGMPSAVQDEGDVVFDVTNDLLYVSLGAGNWKRIGGVNKNGVINGAGIVAQRADHTLVKDAYGFGKCDRFEGMATGTAVTAGVLTQMTLASGTRTGYALAFAGVTLTGTGIVYARTRLEAKDSAAYKNQKASFSVKVYHDVGSGKTFTATIRQADSADDFSSVTEISNSGGKTIWNNAWTTLRFENISMGDCSNGIEIEIRAAVGEITAKNIYFGEFQLEPGPVATDFEHVDYATELAKCKRYTQIIGDDSSSEKLAVGQAWGATGGSAILRLPVEMRTSPSLTVSSAGHFAVWRANSVLETLTNLVASTRTPQSVELSITVAGNLVAGNATIFQSNSASAKLTFSAEL